MIHDTVCDIKIQRLYVFKHDVTLEERGKVMGWEYGRPSKVDEIRVKQFLGWETGGEQSFGWISDVVMNPWVWLSSIYS